MKNAAHNIKLVKENLGALESLDRDDLLQMVKTMISGGIVVNFHGKRLAQEIDKKVRPRQTQIQKKLCVGSPEEQARNMIIEGEKGVWPELYFGMKGTAKPALKRYLSNVKRGVIPM